MTIFFSGCFCRPCLLCCRSSSAARRSGCCQLPQLSLLRWSDICCTKPASCPMARRCCPCCLPRLPILLLPRCCPHRIRQHSRMASRSCPSCLPKLPLLLSKQNISFHKMEKVSNLKQQQWIKKYFVNWPSQSEIYGETGTIFFKCQFMLKDE